MKRWFRRFAKILIVVVVFLILLPVMIFVALQSQQIRTIAVDRIISTVNDDMPGTIEVGSVEGSLLGHVRLRDMRIIDGRGNLAAQVDSADARFGLFALVSQRITIDDLRIDGVTAVARTYEDDILNWDLVFEPEPPPRVVEEPFDWPINIETFSIADGAVAYFDETTELDEETEQLASWFAARVDDLNAADDSADLRNRLNPAFDPDMVSPIAGPRGPAAVWMNDIDFDGHFRMLEHDIEVSIPAFSTIFHADILPGGVTTTAADLSFSMGATTMLVDIASFRLHQWIEARHVSHAMITPPPFEPGQVVTEEDELDRDAFEKMVINLGHWTIFERSLQWAAPDVELAAPLFVRGDMALDPDTLTLVADLSHEEAPEPIELALQLTDYAEEIPSYEAALRADRLQVLDWAPDPDLIPVQTSLRAYAEGHGFDPEDLVANLRLRLDDTIVEEEFEADMVYVNLGIEEGIIEGHRVAAMTPYLDLFATFHFDPQGTALLSARTTADTEQAQRTADLAKAGPERANLELDVEAHFDPEIEDPLQSIVSADASATWDFAEFIAEELRIGGSAGQLDLEIARADDPAGTDEAAYSGTYDIDATGGNFRFEGQRLRSFRLQDQGSFTVLADIDDPVDAIRHFENSASLQIAGLLSPELLVEQANISATVRKTDPARPEAYTRIVTDLRGLRTEDLFAERVEADLNADLRFGDGDNPIEHLRARLVASADSVENEALSIERVDANTATTMRLGQGDDPFALIRHIEIDTIASAAEITLEDQDGSIENMELTTDLSGPLDNLTGDIRTEATEIVFGDEDLSQIVASVVLLEDLRRGQANLDVWRNDDEFYHSGFTFDFDPRYEAFSLYGIEIATEHTSWRSTQESVLRWTGDRVEADDFLLESGDQSIAVDGHFHPEVNQDLHVEVDLDLERFLDGFYLQPLFPQISGDLDLQLDLAGTSSQPVADLTMDLEDLHAWEIGPFTTHLSAEYSDEELRVRLFDLTAFGEEILEASGLFPVAFDMEGNTEVFPRRYSELDVHIIPQELRKFHEPIPLLNDFGVDGTGTVDIQWRGQLEDPDIDVAFNLTGFQFQGEIDDDYFDLRDVDIDTQLSYRPVAADGEGFDFSAMFTWEGEEVAEFTARTPFPLEDWIVAIADGETDDIDWRDEFLRMPLELRASVPALDLSRIPMEELRDNNLAGQAHIDIDLRGSLANPEGHINADLEGLGWAHFRNIDIDLDAEVQDQQLHLEHARFDYSGDEIFSGEGIIPLPIPALLAGEPIADLPVDLRWYVPETPISRLSAIDYEFARIRGTFGASLEITGSLRDPNFTAEAGIFNTRLGDGSDGTLQFELIGADDEIGIDGAFFRFDEPLITFAGEAPIHLDLIELADDADWQAPGELRFNLQSQRIDLEDVVPTQLVSDYILEPEGFLSTELQVRGTWETPSISGFFAISDGAITLPEFARRFVDIDGRVDIDDDEIVISRFELHDGPSSLEMTGTVGHELFIPNDLDLELDADQFNLGGFGVDFPLFVTGGVTAEGSLAGDPGVIDIDVNNLDVVLTDEWDRTLHSTDLDPDIVVLDQDRVSAVADLVDEDPDEIAGLNLLLNISVARNSWARHPAGDVNFMADISIDISGNLIGITGSVETIQGELEFLGRRFSVQESEVIFTGAIPPNPRLQLEAHHYLDRTITQAIGPPTTGEPRIIFRISGSADDPRLELQSDPAMNETDILFVLMTGRPPDRTGVGRDEGVANQALGAVSGLFLGLLQDTFAGTVPLDVVRLEPGASGLRGGRLELGTYVTNDIFVSYRRQFGADENIPSNIVRLEYHFMARWMIEMLYTDRNEGELNLFWDIL